MTRGDPPGDEERRDQPEEDGRQQVHTDVLDEAHEHRARTGDEWWPVRTCLSSVGCREIHLGTVGGVDGEDVPDHGGHLFGIERSSARWCGTT